MHYQSSASSFVRLAKRSAQSCMTKCSKIRCAYSKFGWRSRNELPRIPVSWYWDLKLTKASEHTQHLEGGDNNKKESQIAINLSLRGSEKLHKKSMWCIFKYIFILHQLLFPHLAASDFYISFLYSALSHWLSEYVSALNNKFRGFILFFIYHAIPIMPSSCSMSIFSLNDNKY